MIKPFYPGCLPIRNTAGDWTKWTPNPEWQISLGAKPVDSDGCVSFSAIHAIETQTKFLIGQAEDDSERALAELSGTTLQGNYVSNVYDAILNYGILKNVDWPTLQQFDWNTFYAQIPQDITIKGRNFLKQWSVEFYQVQEKDVALALKSAPLQALIPLAAGHCVEMINQTQYFDSYMPWVKQLGTVNSYFLIYLREKSMTLGYAKDNGDKTIYVQVGNKLIPLADMPAFVNLGGDATSIIYLNPDQFSKFEVASTVLFKSNQ